MKRNVVIYGFLLSLIRVSFRRLLQRKGEALNPGWLHCGCGNTFYMCSNREWFYRRLLLLSEFLWWPTLCCCVHHTALCSSSHSKQPGVSQLHAAPSGQPWEQQQVTFVLVLVSLSFGSFLVQKTATFLAHTHSATCHLGSRPLNWSAAAQFYITDTCTQYIHNPEKKSGQRRAPNAAICFVAINFKVTAQHAWVHITATASGESLGGDGGGGDRREAVSNHGSAPSEISQWKYMCLLTVWDAGRRGGAFRAARPLRLLPQFPFCVSVEIREQKQLPSWLHSKYKEVRTLRIQIATVFFFLAKDDLFPRPSAPPPPCRPVPHLYLKVVNWKNIIQE